ncbi:MAG TPA: GNAT family N-acetyltransferase [Ktedonobacterales bacterium]|nr:GNAT family N-acetyltransferase [Ktedonobacterales bacterium]
MTELDEIQVDTLAACLLRDQSAQASHAASVRLPDGAAVMLRDALPDDAIGLRHMFLRLSDDTRYYYFFTGVPATDLWAERFARLGVSDGVRAYTLIAQVEGEIVGLACFHRGPEIWAAEVGILLADDWQSRGLGRHMLIRLSEEARQRGITTFTGRILGENRRALALARRVFTGSRVVWSGEFEVTACLDMKPEDPE